MTPLSLCLPLLHQVHRHRDRPHLLRPKILQPYLGEVHNQDPIEEQGGLNLYGFCGNNGVNRWDYLGMDPPFAGGYIYAKTGIQPKASGFDFKFTIKPTGPEWSFGVGKYKIGIKSNFTNARSMLVGTTDAAENRVTAVGVLKDVETTVFVGRGLGQLNVYHNEYQYFEGTYDGPLGQGNHTGSTDGNPTWFSSGEVTVNSELGTSVGLSDKETTITVASVSTPVGGAEITLERTDSKSTDKGNEETVILGKISVTAPSGPTIRQQNLENICRQQEEERDKWGVFIYGGSGGTLATEPHTKEK